MIETDAPYMGFKGCRKHPEKTYRKPSRSSPNVPSALAAIAEAVAECYGVDVATIRDHTTRNAVAFFGLR